MTLLVDDLLDLSRLDAGVVPLDLAESEVEPLLDDCLALHAADARSAEVRLERECPPGLRGPLRLASARGGCSRTSWGTRFATRLPAAAS